MNELKIAKALHVAFNHGQVDGAHHKTWVIDQMVRALLGERCAEEDTSLFDIPTTYAQFTQRHNVGEDGPHSYTWDEGTPP